MVSIVLIGTGAIAGATASSEKTYYFPARPKITITTKTTSLQEDQYTKEELKRALSEKIMQEGGNYSELVKVIECESGFNQAASGDSHVAFGIAQFHKDTWNGFNKMRGTNLDYYDALDQIDMMVWSFNHGLQSNWSCWTRLFNT